MLQTFVTLLTLGVLTSGVLTSGVLFWVSFAEEMARDILFAQMFFLETLSMVLFLSRQDKNCVVTIVTTALSCLAVGV